MDGTEAQADSSVDSCLVVLNEDICLEEDVYEFFVRGKVISTKDKNVESDSFVFFPEERMWIERGIALAKAIVQVEEQYVPVKLIKAESAKMVLRRGTKVGYLEKLNVEDGYYENANVMVTQLGKEDKTAWEESQFDKLARDERHKLLEVLKEYEDVFSKDKMDIGCTHLIEHKIDTGDSLPLASPPRRIPIALEEKVDKLVEDLLANDIIRPSDSPWNAPIVIVAKKNGDIRMCVDYRRLNAITKRSVYPIPATQQLLDCLSGSHFFSTLDLSQGYHQIAVAEEDICKTAFATRKGHFEYKRMPFGLTTAPSTFQRLMHIVLQQENWQKCLIYLDDILIFGRSVDEHLQRLKAVLQRIREAGLKLSPSKCFFLKREVEYLGHVVTSDGIRTDPKKIEKVRSWPSPKTVKQLRSFLGFCGYYRRFIKDYAEFAQPLELLCVEDQSNLEKNKKRIQDISSRWTEIQERAFTSLKLALTTAPVLSYPNEGGKFILDTDASNTGIGAVLSQIQNGTERVIAYASRKLTKSERRYCVTRKELLAVYWFVKHFRHYLFGRSFQVRTDHKALLWMLNWKKPNTSQYCLWKAELEMYDMEVTYRPGKIHTNADALSRLPNCQQCDVKHENPVTRRYVKVFGSVTSGEDSEEKKSEHMIMRIDSEPLLKAEWTIKTDPEVGIVVALMRAGKLAQRFIPHAVQNGSPNVKILWKMREQLRIRGDALYFMDGEHYRLVVPIKEREKLITDLHATVGHGGVDKVLFVARKNYYWPGMDKEIQLQVKSCLPCQLNKGKPPKDKAPFQHKVVREPFERIAMDISGPYQPSRHGYRFILAIIDYFSKYPVLIPLKRTDAETVAKKTMKYWIAIFGTPRVIHTDRGTNFESELFKEQCALMGIKKTRTSPYYPQADGLVERLFRTIKPLLSSTVQSRNIPWCEAVPFVEMGLRCTAQASTGYSPYEIVFGKQMQLPLCWQYPSATATKELRSTCQYIQDLQHTMKSIKEKVLYNTEKAVQRQADHYNRNKNNGVIQVGEHVFVKIEGHIPAAFPKNKFCGPYKVIRRNNYWSYQLKDVKNGKVIDRNYNQIKKLHGHHDVTREESNSREISIESVSDKTHKASRHPMSQARPITPTTIVPPTSNSFYPPVIIPPTGNPPSSNICTTRRYPVRQREPPSRLGHHF